MQGIVKVGKRQYCVSENISMDVNIITELRPNEDELFVIHKFFDFVQGCDMTEDEIIDWIKEVNKYRRRKSK